MVLFKQCKNLQSGMKNYIDYNINKHELVPGTLERMYGVVDYSFYKSLSEDKEMER